MPIKELSLFFIGIERSSNPIKNRDSSFIGKKYKGKIGKYRLYDENGNSIKDIDLTNHGNPKIHIVQSILYSIYGIILYFFLALAITSLII